MPRISYFFHTAFKIFNTVLVFTFFVQGLFVPLAFAETATDDSTQTSSVNAPDSTGVDMSGAPTPPINTSTLSQEPTEPIRPVLENIISDNSDGYIARFGYKNDNDTEVTIEVGNDNKFHPSPQDRGQVTTFLPGRKVNQFQVPLSCGQTLVWTLKSPNGSRRTATATAPGCPSAGPNIPAEYQDLYDQLNTQDSLKIVATFKDIEFGETAKIQTATQEVSNQLNIDNLKEFRYTPIVSFALTESNAEEVLNYDQFENIQIDEILETELDQSNIDITNDLLRNATPINYRGRNTYVAVLDTGVDTDHPFIQPNLDPALEACFSETSGALTGNCPSGADTQFGPGASEDCTAATGCGHGSGVSGIAAGADNGSFYGVASEADLMSINVFGTVTASNQTGSFNTDQVLAFEYIYDQKVNNGVNIVAVNLSFGGAAVTSYCTNDIRGPVISALRTVGVATVKSSGNSSLTNAVSNPGCIEDIIVVGNTNTTGAPFTVAPSSNSSFMVDLLAPGTQIQTADLGGTYSDWFGTSFAAPHVAGAFAVLQEAYFDTHGQYAAVDTIEQALKDTGTPITDAKNGLTRPFIDVCAAALELGASVPCGAPATIDARITGSAFNDLNNDGLLDNDEGPRAGMTVDLLDVDLGADPTGNTFTQIATTTTNSIGEYYFENVIPGDYRLRFTNDTSTPVTNTITFRTNTTTTDQDNNDIDPLTGLSDVFVIAAEEEINYIDAGYIEPWFVNGYLWEDTDRDGSSNPGDSDNIFTNGLTVRLFEVPAIGAPIDTGITQVTAFSAGFGLDGFYQFSGLNPHLDYLIEMETPNDTDVPTIPFTAPNPTIDSEFDRATKRTGPFDITTKGGGLIGGGYYQTSSVTGIAWVDTNGDGDQDAGEPGLNGVTVTLTDGSGNPVTDELGNTIGTYTTQNLNGIDGSYIFERLETNQTVRLNFSLPTGYTYTTLTTPITNTNNSDVDGSGDTGTQTTSYGADIDYIDAGYQIVAAPVDIEVTKNVDDNTPDAGQTILYTINAENLTGVDATNVQLTDNLPAGVTYQSVGSVTQGTYDDVTGIWDVGTITAGTAQTLVLEAIVDLGTSGSTITNTATVTNVDQIDSDNSNDSSDVDITVNNFADLDITTLIVSPIPGQPGQTVQVSFTFINNGPSVVNGVNISEVIPAVAYESVPGITFTTVNPNTPLNPGDTGNAVYEFVLANQGSYPQNYTIGGRVDSTDVGQTDPDGVNNEMTTTYQINPPNLVNTDITGDLEPNIGTNNWISCTPSTLVSGQNTTCSGIVPANYTPTTIDVEINGTGVSCTVTGQAFSCPVITLNNSGSFDVVVDSENGGTFVDSGFDVTVNLFQADLEITNIAISNANPQPGDIVQVTVDVTNNGPDSANPVNLSTLVDAGGFDVGYGINVTSNTIPTPMNSGDSGTFVFEFEVENQGSYPAGYNATGGVSLSAATQTDPGTSNNTASIGFTVQTPEADLVISNYTIDNQTPQPGDLVTVRYELTNNGPKDSLAINDGITGFFPLGLATAPGVTVITDTITAGLANGASGILEYTFVVAAQGSYPSAGTLQSGAVHDTALVVDPDLSNNTSNLLLTVIAPDLTNADITGDLAPNLGTNNWISCTPDTLIVGQSTTCSGTVPNDYLPNTIDLQIDGNSVSCTVTGQTFTCPAVALNNTGTFDVLVDSENGGTFVDSGFDVIVNNQSVDVEVTNVSFNATNPQPGDIVQVTVDVINNGPNAVPGLNFGEVIPAGAFDAGYGIVPVSNTFVFPLNSGDSGSFVYEFEVAPQASYSTNYNIGGQATTSSGVQNDANGGNNSATATLTIIAPDLTNADVTSDLAPNLGTNNWISCTPTAFDAGSSTTCSGTVPNNYLPNTIDIQIDNTNVTCTVTGQTFTCPALTESTPGAFDVLVDVENGGIFVDSGFDVTINPQGVDIEVTNISFNPTATGQPGDIVEVTVEFTNNGPYPLNGVGYGEIIPAAAFDAGYGTNITNINVPIPLPVGGTGDFTYDFQVADQGSYPATFNIGGQTIATSGGQTDPDTSNNNLTAVFTVNAPESDLEIFNYAISNQNPQPGDTVVVRYEVRNNGPKDTASISDGILGFFPFGLAAPGSYNNLIDTITGGLASGATGVFEFEFIVGTQGSYPFNYPLQMGPNHGLGSLHVDPDLSNNFQTLNIDVQSPPPILPNSDLVLSGTSTSTDPVRGESYQYTFTVTNNGPDDLTGIQANMILSAGLQFDTASDPNYNNAAGTWNIPTLTSGSSVNVIVDVTVLNAADAGATLSLGGTIIAPTTPAQYTETNPGDEAETVSNTVSCPAGTVYDGGVDCIVDKECIAPAYGPVSVAGDCLEDQFVQGCPEGGVHNVPAGECEGDPLNPVTTTNLPGWETTKACFMNVPIPGVVYGLGLTDNELYDYNGFTYCVNDMGDTSIGFNYVDTGIPCGYGPGATVFIWYANFAPTPFGVCGVEYYFPDYVENVNLLFYEASRNYGNNFIYNEMDILTGTINVPAVCPTIPGVTLDPTYGPDPRKCRQV
jgi:uncharacterized repeat protein (TIGR01451 family)